MGVISFSVDEETKRELEQLAQEERRSKSDIFVTCIKPTRLINSYEIQKIGKEKFLALV